MMFRTLSWLANGTGFVLIGVSLGWLPAIGLQLMIGSLTARARIHAAGRNDLVA